MQRNRKPTRSHSRQTEQTLSGLVLKQEILKDIDELTELSKESQWMQCKQVLIDAMTSERLDQKTAWRLFVKLQSIEGQSQHLEYWEKELIALLRNTMKYSLSTIAFILDRSKETVYRYAEVI